MAYECIVEFYLVFLILKFNGNYSQELLRQIWIYSNNVSVDRIFVWGKFYLCMVKGSVIKLAEIY